LTSNDIDRYAVDVMYFEIKTLDVKRVDIERSEVVMVDGHFAATSLEVEAERRREVLVAEMRVARAPRPRVAGLRARLLTRLRGSQSERPAQAGRLNQKRV
jgi:hypothetical protein